MDENERMQAAFARITRRQIFANARSMATPRHKREPNWAFAMSLFGLGSTYAWALCNEMGVDPDETTATPWQPLNTAPRDGRLIRLARDNGCTWDMWIGRWDPDDDGYAWQVIGEDGHNNLGEERPDYWCELEQPAPPYIIE